MWSKHPEGIFGWLRVPAVGSRWGDVTSPVVAKAEPCVSDAAHKMLG